MEYETTFQNEITASSAVEDNMFSYTRYNNIEILPSCVDGLKLCQRRIIGVLGTTDQRMKGAALTGDVMNKLHPHGDTGIYDAIVRLGQPFSQVLPFVTIKGNCGAYGGGEYAASRYLDVQYAQFTKDLFFNNVDSRTLTYIPSELGKGVEPAYYVPRVPTALLMGAFGVSVAYKSVIPHFNFVQVCNMVEKFIELRKKYPMNYQTKYDEIAEYCIPDFPTHCYIRNKQELIQHYNKGDYNTSILMDGMVEIGPYEINLRTVPHGLAFERVFKKVGDMMNSANFISANFTEVNDLTKGIEYGNIQFKMKRGVNPFLILDQFKKECTFTQTWTPIWIFVDKDGNVCRLNPMQLLEVWYLARHRSILGALKFQNIDLFKQYRKLMALIIIADHTDAVLKIFKEAENREATIPVLVKKFKLTREQAEYISSLQLHQITRQGKDDLLKNLDNVKERIENLQKKFVDIDSIILEDVAYLKKTYGPQCARRSELPNFIGAIHLVDLNGFIQFKNYQELAHLMRRWSKTQQVDVIMYPTGSYKLVRHVGKQVINDDLIDFPKEFYADRLEVCKLKPRVSIGLRNGAISRIEGIVSFDKKVGILAHASGGLTVVDKAFKLRQVSSTDIPKRNSFEALGNKSDILYFNGTYADEVVIAVVNDKNPNQVDLQRMKDGDSYRKLMLGHSEIIGMWKYGNPISFTVPGRYLSRCGIKQVLIRNPEQFFENNTKVTIFMNKHRTSTDKHMVPLSKGVDILSESSIKGDKHVE